MSTRPRSQRQQSLLDRLTALLPSSLTSWRRQPDRLSFAAEALTSGPYAAQLEAERRARLEGIGLLPPESRSTATAAATAAGREEPDADAPVALLLPGMSNLALDTSRNFNSLCNLPVTDVLTPPYVHKASRQPDLFLTLLPPEVHFAIFEAAELSLYDLLALRNTCHRLRRLVPIGSLETQLRVQNYAGWRVVFEMNGHKYPGTTYGNRRLCGRCVVPKIRGHLIDGAAVQAYLTLRRANGDKESAADGEGEWPEERGMCFPCLWTVLVSMGSREEIGEKPRLGVSAEMEIYKLAAISPKERFRMMDGTTRKMCELCSRDIHENAVPCPHCTNFAEWCRTCR
jgi:hypothetical protein